jgi:hypothetical protein
MTWATRVIGVILLLTGCALLGPTDAHAAGPLTWSAPTNIEFASGGTPTAVACATADLCLVGDDAGDVLSATDPTGGPHAWTGAAVDVAAGSHHAITGLACPSTSLCVAVDDAGGVLTTSDPTGPAAAWTRAAVDPSSVFTGVSCASASYCVAVDEAGDAWSTRSPAGGVGAWVSADLHASGSLTAVSCPTDAFCAAVDHGGDVLTDTAQSPDWMVTKLTSHALDAVSCASATLCVAGGVKTGAISSSAPTSGAPAWRTQRITQDQGGPETVSSVGCSQPSTCLVGVESAGYYQTIDPIGGDWTPAGGENDFDPIALSCAPTGGCAGVDDEGDFGGLTANGLFGEQIEGAAPNLNGVSCPRADRCFADDDSGQLLTSKSPTRGSTSWSVSSLIPGAEADNVPYQLACPSASLCLSGIGYDQRGDAGTTGPELAGVSTTPTVARSWRLFHPSRHPGFNDITCTSISLCVFSDDDGQLYASRHPSQGHSWSPVSSSSPAEKVYCPRQGRCLGPNTTCPTRAICVHLADRTGTIAVSTAPTRRRSRWKPLTIDPGHDLTGIACPAAGLCYAVDHRGAVLVSTHPAAASSWSVADRTRGSLTAIACPTSRFCIAVGENGLAVTASKR